MKRSTDDTKPRGRLRRLFGLPRRFAREDGGASIVEFAIIGPMFIFVVLAMMESASIYWVDRILQSYAADLARSHRTGFVGTVTEDDGAGNMITRQEDLCRDRVVNLMFNCTQMMVDVRPTSAVVDIRNPDGSINTSALTVSPGGSGTVNIVRVYYNWPRIVGVPFTPAGQARDDGDVELYAASGFVTE